MVPENQPHDAGQSNARLLDIHGSMRFDLSELHKSGSAEEHRKNSVISFGEIIPCVVHYVVVKL